MMSEQTQAQAQIQAEAQAQAQAQPCMPTTQVSQVMKAQAWV